MKKCVGFFLAFMLLCGCIFSSIGIAPREVLAADAGYVAKDAPASVNAGYTPTQLQEGSFEHLSLDKVSLLTSTSGYIDAIYGLPWKTTDSVYEYVGNKYDVGYVNDYASENTPFGDVCVEMNATRDGVLYQDLPTNARDIIFWSLYHAPRSSPQTQSMSVSIGAPAGAPSAKNPNLQNGAVWTPDSLTGTGGYDVPGGRAGLTVTVPSGGINASTKGTWKQIYGVYIVPEGQATTRFAFTALIGGNHGNLLDNIHFDTLLGNLKVTNAGENLHVTGHWGKCDQNAGQTLDYLFQDKDGATVASGSIDMSQLTGDDFQVDIDISKIGLDENSMAEFWHSAYPDAKTPVDLSMLFFRDDPKYDIPKADVGKPTTPIDVTDGVSGGKPGYTFSAEGLPDGFSISADGVITGSYSHGTKPGTATLKVTDSEGAWRTIEIAYGGTGPIDISKPANKITVDPIPTQAYTGNPVTPEPVVKDGDGNILVKGKDYTVEYRDNVEPGQASAVITGIGDYTGTIEAPFEIKGPPEVIKNPEPGRPERPILPQNPPEVDPDDNTFHWKAGDVYIRTADGGSLGKAEVQKWAEERYDFGEFALTGFELCDADGQPADGIDLSRAGHYGITVQLEKAGGDTLTFSVDYIVKETADITLKPNQPGKGEGPDGGDTLQPQDPPTLNPDNTVTQEYTDTLTLPTDPKPLTPEDAKKLAEERYKAPEGSSLKVELFDKDGNPLSEISREKEGSYLLKITFQDPAGNLSIVRLTLNIARQKSGAAGSPKTGDQVRRQFWATLMMLFICTGAILELFKHKKPKYICKH